MQKTQRIIYRERLSPSLWLLVAAAVIGPMVALVFSPFDTTLALAAGAAAGVGLVAALIGLSSVVEVSDGVLRAGRASIPVHLLGEATAATGDAARMARGTALGRNAWHLIRGGIDGIITVPVLDPDDPVDTWVISSRTPDRLASAIERAKG